MRRIDEVMKKAGIRVEEHIPLLPQGGSGTSGGSNIVITTESPPGPLALPNNVLTHGVAPPNPNRMLTHQNRRFNQ